MVPTHDTRNTTSASTPTTRSGNPIDTATPTCFTDLKPLDRFLLLRVSLTTFPLSGKRTADSTFRVPDRLLGDEQEAQDPALELEQLGVVALGVRKTL